MAQLSIPFMQIRGGSSKGVFLHAADLPTTQAERDKVILAIMEGVGPGDLRQIDGLGGADSLTAKVAVVSPSSRADADLDYLFVQVVLGEGRVSTSQECGNILAGVLPFAIESGLMAAEHPTTTATIHMVNTGGLCEVTVQTPYGEITYAGDTKVDGVPGMGAPIVCNYLGIAGASCGALLPTGQVENTIDGIEATCIDNGMPVVLLRARDVGISGYESKVELDANLTLKARLEKIRLLAGPLMNLGDVKEKTVPKMCLISPARSGGLINTRTFIPHVCHAAIGVLGAVSVATGVILPGAVAANLLDASPDFGQPFSVEHPSGAFSVQLGIKHLPDDSLEVYQSAVIRTARLISKGEVYLPATSG